MDFLFIPSFSSLRHLFPYSHPSLLLWNFPRSLISLVLAFIACLCALTGTMGLPSPSLFCNYAFVFTLLLFPLPIYSHHCLYAPHTVATLPSLVNSLFSLNVSSRFEPCSPLFSHSPAIFLLLQDEPSSGMDPRTKRHLWKIISEEVKGKCAVVLTSHR